MNKLLLGPAIRRDRDEGNVKKRSRKENTEQKASKNRAKTIQPVLGLSKGSCFDFGSWNLWLNIFPLNLHNSTVTVLKTSSLFCTLPWPFLEGAESLLLDSAGYKRNPFLLFLAWINWEKSLGECFSCTCFLWGTFCPVVSAALCGEGVQVPPSWRTKQMLWTVWHTWIHPCLKWVENTNLLSIARLPLPVVRQVCIIWLSNILVSYVSLNIY